MSDDNTYGRGHIPMPANIASLGRYCAALKPSNLLDHKVFPETNIHMLVVPASHGFSIMVADMRSLIRQGFVKMSSNDPGEISLYFKTKGRDR